VTEQTNPYATDEYWKDRATTEGPHSVDGHDQPEDTDAFSPENIGVVQFIVLSRILDTLYALHQVQDPEKHVELLEAHAQGLLLGPSPTFQGLFLTDEINREQ
jgi:hypothetical protein